MLKLMQKLQSSSLHRICVLDPSTIVMYEWFQRNDTEASAWLCQSVKGGREDRDDIFSYIVHE